MLTKVKDATFKTSTDFGSFFCSIEAFEHFRIARRHFETGGDSMSIPFTSSEPCIEMIFSLDGQSAFNDRFHPYVLSPGSHCINLSHYYECRNLLDENARQNDITFRLRKSFYTDLISGHLSSSDDRLPVMILHHKEFNTINQHLPTDAAILGILNNVMDCPFKGQMRSAYIREHVRALLTLQIFHFSPIVTGKNIQIDGRINKRDEDILQEVKKYIDAHFLDPNSIETLTKHFGINEFKLKHGFKVLFETSPMRYLQSKRLEYSRFLLRETNKTIKEIADEIGYAHAANFTVAFSRTFGDSPLHYRTGRGDVFEMEDEIAA